MKLLKFTTKDGKTVIANIDNISFFYERSENETVVAFINEPDNFVIPVSIKELGKRLEASDNCVSVFYTINN